MDERRERLAFLRRERARTHAAYLATLGRASVADTSPACVSRVVGDRMAIDRIDREIEAITRIHSSIAAVELR